MHAETPGEVLWTTLSDPVTQDEGAHSDDWFRGKSTTEMRLKQRSDTFLILLIKTQQINNKTLISTQTIAQSDFDFSYKNAVNFKKVFKADS